MKVKIINNEIVYPCDFMFIESEGNWVSYPNEQMLFNDGFKDVEYVEVDNLLIPFEEFDNKIIIFLENNNELIV